MSTQPSIQFNDGHSIPQVGLGVWQTPNDTAAMVVKTALDAGYRHVDTAAIYENESGVGEGLIASGLPRSEIFLTTKLWNDRHSFDDALTAFDQSLARLKTDYVDLFLIHWPSPHRGKYVEAWKALIRLKEEGRAKSIGVSNFYPEHLERIIGETGVVPVLNQVELHPDFQQKPLREFHEKHGIKTQSWSPLGQGHLLANPVITEVAERLGKSVAQVIIRWHMEKGLIVIPKSVTPSRIVENFQVFDFELGEAATKALDALDGPGNRVGPDPMTATF